MSEKRYTIPALEWQEVLRGYYVASVPRWGKYTVEDRGAPGSCLTDFVVICAGGQPMTARPISGCYSVRGAQEACQRDFEEMMAAILKEEV